MSEPRKSRVVVQCDVLPQPRLRPLTETLAPSFVSLLQYATLRGPYAIHVLSLSPLPCVMCYHLERGAVPRASHCVRSVAVRTCSEPDAWRANSCKPWRAETTNTQLDSTPTNLVPLRMGFTGQETQQRHGLADRHSLTGALFLPHIGN